MTIAERGEAVQLIADTQGRIDEFDAIQVEIDKLERVKGEVYRVNLVANGEHAVAISDPDIVAKAEIAVEKLLTAKVATQEAI